MVTFRMDILNTTNLKIHIIELLNKIQVLLNKNVSIDSSAHR